jgi:hypothetical protein
LKLITGFACRGVNHEMQTRDTAAPRDCISVGQNKIVPRNERYFTFSNPLTRLYDSSLAEITSVFQPEKFLFDRC